MLAIESDLTFKIVHVHTDSTRLTAFTNTQGRFLNQSNNPCLQNAINPSGRFIHIEQEFDRFRQDHNGWDLIRQGLDSAFECQILINGAEILDNYSLEIIPSDDQFTILG